MADTVGKTIKCRAAVAWEPKKPLVIEQIEVQPPKEGEMMYTAICHTDLFQVSGIDPKVKFPTVVGHEGAGVVESVGPGVESVRAGDHVIPLPLSQCRKCDICVDSKSNLCRKFMYFSENQQALYDGTTRFSCRGKPVYHFLGCSTFSEYTVTPEISVAKIDQSVPLDKAALLGCGVPTGYGSPIKGCPVNAGSTVGVWGLGAVGLAVVMGARDMGAKNIVAIDHEYLALLSFNFCPKNLTTQAFECSKMCIGKTCILGVSGQNVTISNGLLLQGRTVMGICVGGFKTRDDIPMLAQKYQKGEILLDEFISWRCSLEQINEAWDKLQRGDGIRSIVAVSKE
uniref:ADH_N domain-containing protein n=1 Tax=Globodera pallida TaxID=36090 RepID=A0A183C2P9_GLOPA